MVNVSDDDRDRFPCAFRPAALAVERDIETTPIWNSGQGISGGKLL